MISQNEGHLNSKSDPNSGVNLSKIWIGFLVLFLLVFPKAGIKIGPLPLTVGYNALALTAIFTLLRRGLRLNRNRLIATGLLIPFQITSLYAFVCHGIISSEYFISFLACLFILPWFFFGFFSEIFETLDLTLFFRLIKNGIFWVALYGIFVFFFYILTGNLVLIPFLATNIHDINFIETTKCIVRGDWLKLISTYQNGILYGVSLLMLLPLYTILEENTLKRSVVKLSLILTLSRTIWIGLFLCHLFEYFFQKQWTRKRFFLFFFQMFIGATALTWILYSLNFDLNFLFDPALGGRREQFEVLQDPQFLGNSPFGGIAEILYLGIFHYFGVIGFLSFLVAMISPIFLYWITQQSQDPVKQALALGLITYLLIAWGDSAFLYIPVMGFYWALSSILLSNRNLIQGERIK